MTRSEIVAAYAQGQHLRQIAKAAGRSHEWVRTTLLREGVEMRPRYQPGKRQRRMSALAVELSQDLPNFREPVTAEVVVDWFGCSHDEAGRAVAELFGHGQISIIGVAA